MIVSHRHKFIFMKTTKTASSSMEIALSGILGPDDILTPARAGIDELRLSGAGGQNYRLDHPDVPKRPLWRKVLRRPEKRYHPTVGFYDHMPAWRVRRYLGDEVWNSYYKFAFERNPWDRQVSFYHYKTRTKPADKMPTFEAFLARGHKAHVNNWAVYAIGDEIALDYVGRYESVETDFKKALADIGLTGETELPRANVSEKRPQERPYQDYFTSETRELVAKWCSREIAHFGYEF